MKINPVGSNQTEVQTPNALILFSYQTPVAARIGGAYYVTEHKWSVTTSRHINAWLGGRIPDYRKPQSFFDALV